MWRSVYSEVCGSNSSLPQCKLKQVAQSERWCFSLLSKFSLTLVRLVQTPLQHVFTVFGNFFVLDVGILPGFRHTTHYILHHTTPHYTTPHHTTPHHTTLNYTTLHYPTLPHIALHYITLHSLHHQKCNCSYTTLISLHRNYNSTTLQLQLQLHYTTLHPAVVGEVTDKVTTATIAATLKHTAPTTFRSISGFALPSVIHNNQPLLWVSYF